ncbi:MAG: hypothetical protein JWO80_2698, partial [Bryobacterales bacterium]|nr:hypothetical protein [Bryobacterales bacterium]
SSPLAPALVTSHSVSISGLTANTSYHYRVKSNDGSGLVASGDLTFTTPSVPDTTPPTISITTPVTGQTVAGQVSIGASASDNVGVVGVQFAIDVSSLNAELTSPPYSTVWDTTAVSNGTHIISAIARDAAGNHTTSAAVSVNVSNPTTRSLVDTTVADFAAGTGTNTYLSMTADGEVMQAPAVGLEFSSLPPGWSAAPWSAGGGVSLSGGKLNVDGALYMPGTYYAPGASLTFVATFSGDGSQHIGFGTDFQGAPWAIFSTFGGGALYVRTNSGTQSLATLIPGNNLGAPHLFRIDWQANGFIYWVDNVQVASHVTPIGTSMRPLLSDAFPGAGVISVDWLRMSPYATPATFVSRVMDAGAQAIWSTLTWTADTPTGTNVAMSVRNGNTNVPDASWTAFRGIASGSSVGFSSRYLQYQALLSSSTPVLSAALRDVTVQYDTSISNVQATNVTTSGAAITWTTNTPSTSQVDYGTTIGYGSSTPLNSTLLTSHSVSLTGLQSGTAYHYRVESNNGSTLTISGDFTFQTAAIPDTTPPVVSMTAPAPGAVGGTVTVSANASDNVAVAGVQFLLDSSNLGAEVTTPPYSIAWNSTLTANGPHTVSATARDAAGNRTTAAGVGVTVMNNGLLTMTDTTAADFAAGSGTNTYISITGNGEIIQAPAVGAEFTTFPAGWTSAPWSAGGNSLVNGGKIAVDGALLSYGSSFGPGRSLEFVATFTGGASQHAGFGTDFQSAPWAIFSTWGGGATLYARSYNGSQSSGTALPGSYIGAPHKYRIDWTTSGFVYSIDGTQVLNDPVPVAAAMRPLVSDAIPGGGAVTLDWLRMSPYASSATFTSRVLDAGATVNWSTLAWSGTLPAGTGLALSVRKGNTPVPDGSWTSLSPVTSSGGSIGGSSRYIQYQAQLTTNNPAQTAALNDVTISYTP